MSDCEREWRSESRLLAPGLFAYQAHGSKWAVGPAVRRVFYCVSGVRNHICNAVGETVDSEFFGATGAAKDQASYFHAVTDNTNAAMLTDRRQRLNRTFEAIEHMRDVIASHFETFVVVISASFTLRHDRSLIEILMEVIPDLVAPTRTSGEDLPLNIRGAGGRAGRLLAFPPQK